MEYLLGYQYHTKRDYDKDVDDIFKTEEIRKFKERKIIELINIFKTHEKEPQV